MAVAKRSTAGAALIDGVIVADRITLTEARDERYVRVPGASGLKDISVGLPSELTFDGDLDQELERRLQTIVSVHASGDIEAARRLRDSGGRAIALDLQLDDGRQLNQCSVTAPIHPHGSLRSLRFTINH